MNIKQIIISNINKTNFQIFCFIRNVLEFIFFNQKFNLKYNKSNLYTREYKDLGVLFFPNKYRTIMYGRGATFRLNSLAKFYFLDKINFTNGDKIIDCGANIGEINLIFKQKNILVDYYAFEPSTKDFDCLKLNAKSNNLYKKGLWNEKSKKTFFIKSNSADSSFFEIDEFETKEIIEVDKLDNFQLDHIKLLKVEAEGAEPEVLQGAKNTLKSCEYVVVDAGKERGIKKEETSMFVCNYLLSNNYELLYINHERITLLFKNKLF